MADEFVGIGTQLQIGDGATPTENFVTIANVNDIDGPNSSVDTIEVTNMDSPGAVRQYIAGLIEPGEISFDVNWVPTNAGHQQLKSDFDNRTIRNFQMIWPNASNTKLEFAGIITSYGITTPMNDKVRSAITIQVTSVPVLTPAP